MNKWLVLMLVSLVMLLVNSGKSAEVERYRLWVANPLVSIFKDDKPLKKGIVTDNIWLQAARGEYEPFQICISSNVDLKDVRLELHPLVRSFGGYAIGKENIWYNWVGMVPVKNNTGDVAESGLLRKAPDDFPDPLLEELSISLKAGETRACWVTVWVPVEALAGRYRGKVELVTEYGRHTFNVYLQVFPFELPQTSHLWVTNWFNAWTVAKFHQVEFGSADFWRVLKLYAKNMAAHRQNVIWVHPRLIKIYQEEDGGLSFDYGAFDKWVEVFEEEGVAERIEISHLGGSSYWRDPEVNFQKLAVIKREDGSPVDMSAEEVLKVLLPDLERHLKERGWLNKVMIHIADEPIPVRLKAWQEKSGWVKKLAPNIRRIEAIQVEDLTGYLEVWVPQLDFLDRHYAGYHERQKKGDIELWFYTCCNPKGNYPNRFIDFPLIKTRLLHWLNYRYDAIGYLHWGWNWWTDEPFKDVEPSELPPGDAFIVYPGSGGPLNSVRWEQMREGLEDYEYFWLLGEKIREVSQKLGVKAAEYVVRVKELIGLVVDSPTRYSLSLNKLFDVRRAVAREIVEVMGSPLILVRTEPSAVEEVKAGKVDVYGVTEPGVEVSINGKAIEVGSDGKFKAKVQISAAHNRIGVIAQLGDKRKELVRVFKVKD